MIRWVVHGLTEYGTTQLSVLADDIDSALAAAREFSPELHDISMVRAAGSAFF